MIRSKSLDRLLLKRKYHQKSSEYKRVTEEA